MNGKCNIENLDSDTFYPCMQLNKILTYQNRYIAPHLNIKKPTTILGILLYYCPCCGVQINLLEEEKIKPNYSIYKLLRKMGHNKEEAYKRAKNLTPLENDLKEHYGEFSFYNRLINKTEDLDKLGVKYEEE